MKDEALKLALEALEYHTAQTRPITRTQEAITAIKQALAAPVQGPVAYVTGTHAGRFVIAPLNPAMVLPVNMALYTTPPAAQRTWVGLTETDIKTIEDNASTKQWAILMTEATLKEKNNG